MLVLDAGDYSMGTPFGAATREIGGELQLMSRMGTMPPPSATMSSTSGLTVWAGPSAWPAKAGRVPAVLASNTGFTGDDATLADLQRLAQEG